MIISRIGHEFINQTRYYNVKQRWLLQIRDLADEGKLGLRELCVDTLKVLTSGPMEND